MVLGDCPQGARWAQEAVCVGIVMSELNSLLLFGSAPKGAIEATSNRHDKRLGKTPGVDVLQERSFHLCPSSSKRPKSLPF